MDNLVEELDSYIQSFEEKTFYVDYSLYKNLYLYVTEKQLLSILEKPRLKLSRTTKTNDCTENLACGETDPSYEVSSYGYICLSSTIHSSMMWGQYAGRSTGACLVFSGVFYSDIGSGTEKIYLTEIANREKPIKPSFLDKKICIHKEKYTDEKVPSDAPIEQKLTTKAKGWEQECEYRLLIPLTEADRENTNLFYSFYDKSSLIEALSRIVLGPLCSLDLVDVEMKINESMGIGLHGTAPIRVTKATIDTEKNIINPNLDKVKKKMPGWSHRTEQNKTSEL